MLKKKKILSFYDGFPDSENVNRIPVDKTMGSCKLDP